MIMAQQRKRNRKWLYWGLILVLVIVAGVVIYLVWNNYFRDRKDEGGQQVTAGQVEEKQKEIKVEEDDVEGGEVEEKKVKQYEGEDPNLAEGLTGVVTYAGVNGDKLVIRVNIDQYLTDGSCELTLTRDGAGVYAGTANIVGSPTTSSCEGFDVPVAGLGAGDYVIEIKINSGGKTGTIKGETKI